jgi:hypothetical protein
MSWVNSSNLKNTLTLTIAAGGTGYAVGDVLTIVQTGSAGGTASVATISAGGVVTSVTFLTAGTGYYVANTLATTVAPAGGSSCTLNITAVNYIGATAKAKQYVFYIAYTKGDESTAVLSISTIKNDISTTTQFKLSPDNTATPAQLAFTLSATNNFKCPLDISKTDDYIVATLTHSGSTPTGTITIKGYPDLSYS